MLFPLSDSEILLYVIMFRLELESPVSTSFRNLGVRELAAHS